MKSIFIVKSALLLAATVLSTAMAEPILLASNSVGDTYADPENLKIEPWGFSYISITNVRSGTANSMGRSVGSIEFSYLVMCSNQTQKMVRAISFAEKWGKGAVLNTAATRDTWEPIAEGSVNDVMRVAFCN